MKFNFVIMIALFMFVVSCVTTFQFRKADPNDFCQRVSMCATEMNVPHSNDQHGKCLKFVNEQNELFDAFLADCEGLTSNCAFFLCMQTHMRAAELSKDMLYKQQR